MRRMLSKLFQVPQPVHIDLGYVGTAQNTKVTDLDGTVSIRGKDILVGGDRTGFTLDHVPDCPPNGSGRVRAIRKRIGLT